MDVHEDDVRLQIVGTPHSVLARGSVAYDLHVGLLGDELRQVHSLERAVVCYQDADALVSHAASRRALVGRSVRKRCLGAGERCFELFHKRLAVSQVVLLGTLLERSAQPGNVASTNRCSVTFEYVCGRLQCRSVGILDRGLHPFESHWHFLKEQY